jgi:hypothetical protein
MGMTLKQMLYPILATAALLLFLVYLGDYLSVRFTIPKSRVVYGSIQVNDYLAVPLKNGKDEFDFVGSEQTTCTHSLFPQMGYAPCWWLNRHREKREQL